MSRREFDPVWRGLPWPDATVQVGDAAVQVATVTSVVYDPEVGALVELRLPDGRLVYGFDPYPCEHDPSPKETPVAICQSRRLLQQVQLNGGVVWFTNADDDLAETDETQMQVPEGDWKAWGSPEKITVTIDPGDLLNQ